MEEPKFLVIGAVAAGTKAAAKIKRERPGAGVTVITREHFISYAGCGLPYYLSGVIKEQRELVVKGPKEFASDGIEVLCGYEAEEIRPGEKLVMARNLEDSSYRSFTYDHLILATGASPVAPSIPGGDLRNVFTLRSVPDAVGIRGLVEAGKLRSAVVVGGGYAGLEAAENLASRGIETCVVELADYILPGFDPEISLIIRSYLESKGMTVKTGDRVNSLEGNNAGDVTGVHTDRHFIPADLVVWTAGIKPNADLARKAGIIVGPTGAIKVNANMETNIPGIFAVGDCAENIQRQTGNAAWFPMGSTANKAGRIAGINVCGGQDAFPGVLGTAVIKLFSLNAARTGLTETEARKAGFQVETVLVPANDRAHYYPGAKTVVTKLIADRASGRLLGAQVFGQGVVDKPVDILVTLISLGGTVDDLAHLDLAYAPPFSMAMSSTIVAANVLRNKLSGRLAGISPLAARELVDDSGSLFVDVRSPAEVATGAIPNSLNIPLPELRRRADEIDRRKDVILVCKIGKRAYLGYLILKELEFEQIRILDGGTTCWPFETVK